MGRDQGQSPAAEGAGSRWWEQRYAVLALVLLSAVPLLKPGIPPLVDLPGHMARYRVQLDIADAPALRNFYNFEWALIGNLGLDLLVIPLSAIFGLELAVKLIVITIPVLTVAGFLWVAREVHGRVPPTALFAVPFAYNFPLHFGFVNSALSMGFAFLAFGLWLRLARFGYVKLRAALFVPISLLIWVTHTFGWGTLGVLAFSAELVRQTDLGRTWFRSAFNAALHCASMAPPILLMLAWRSGGHVQGQTGDWFNWEAKLIWVASALRDRWATFDVLSLALIGGLLILALARWRGLRFSRNLAASALFLLLVFILLPRVVFGSAYADMRLAPYAFAVAIIAIRFRPGAGTRLGPVIAAAGLAFVLVRTAASTASLWLYDRDYDRTLAALEHVPRNARLLTFIGQSCYHQWDMTRLEHISGIAVVRRHAFSNDQWSMAGAQLLTVRYRNGGRFVGDPSQMVTRMKCPGEYWRTIHESLATFPRAGFDYVWLVQPPPYDPALTGGLQPIWRSGTSVLYRVVDRRPPQVHMRGL